MTATAIASPASAHMRTAQAVIASAEAHMTATARAVAITASAEDRT